MFVDEAKLMTGSIKPFQISAKMFAIINKILRSEFLTKWLWHIALLDDVASRGLVDKSCDVFEEPLVSTSSTED
jgi:hypothetical protein